MRWGPVMVASGCGGTGPELAPYVEMAGLDFVTRSITRDARRGGPSPRIAESAYGLVNAIGLHNPGVDHFLASELPWLVRAGARVFVSIAGSTIGEYADLARRLGNAPGITGLEINLGAPDQVGEGLFDVREPYHAASIVAAVRREFPADLAVLAKLRPDVSRIVEGARGVVDAGATAVVIGNAVPASMPDGRPGGLSGPSIAPIALRCVSEAREHLADVSIVGAGGVADARGARDFLASGASAVQIGTALLHDPTTVARVIADLNDEETS